MADWIPKSDILQIQLEEERKRRDEQWESLFAQSQRLSASPSSALSLFTELGEMGAATLLSPFTKTETGVPAVKTWTPASVLQGGETRKAYEAWQEPSIQPFKIGEWQPTFGVKGVAQEIATLPFWLIPGGKQAQFAKQAEKILARQLAGKALKKTEQAFLDKIKKETPEQFTRLTQKLTTKIKPIPPTALKPTSRVARRVARKLSTVKAIPTDEVLSTKVKGAYEYALRHQKEWQATYKKVLGEKAGKMEAIFAEKKGVESFFKAQAALKGVTPKELFKMPAEFQITKVEADAILNKLYGLSKTLDTFETRNISEAILKLSGLYKNMKTGLAEPLTKADLEVLQATFPELRPLFEAYKSFGAKAWGAFVDVLNLPRAILSSGDMSVTFRQLAMALARKPQYLPGVIKTQLKVIFSPKNYDDIEKVFLENPDVQLFIKNKLYWAPTPGQATPKLWQREEQFMSNLAERIPILGKFVRASERAFNGGANYMRAQVAKDYTQMLRKMGALTDDNIEGLAKVINAATGRGDLPSALKDTAPFVNAIFFSPRYLLSRIQLPAMMFSSNPIVQKEAIRTFVQFMIAGSSVLGLTSMAGAKVEMNPLSSDFGKMKIGNTRLDIWTGYSQWTRMLAQLITNERKTTTTGKMQELNRYETLLRFLQSKQSPLASLITDLLAGRTYIGEPMEANWETVKRELKNRLTPLFVQDLLEAIQANGLIGGLYASPAFLGIGAVSYEDKLNLKGGGFENKFGTKFGGKSKFK